MKTPIQTDNWQAAGSSFTHLQHGEEGQAGFLHAVSFKSSSARLFATAGVGGQEEEEGGRKGDLGGLRGGSLPGSMAWRAGTAPHRHAFIHAHASSQAAAQKALSPQGGWPSL